MSENVNVTGIFGENVFNEHAMRERLPKKVYKELHKTIDEGWSFMILTRFLMNSH